MDAGDGEVERNLLVRLERQVGQIERIAIDPVPVLLVSRQALGEDGDAFVSEQSLVALEGLAAGGMFGRVARDLVRDGIEREGLLRLEQHQHEVGDALEPVELGGGRGGRGGGGHRHEPKTSAATPVTC